MSLTMWRLFALTTLFSVAACHPGHHHVPGEISHYQSASFLWNREKRATNCFNEVACEYNKADCQNQNEPVREQYCAGFTCPSGQTCYLSTPCPAHYTRSCIADPCASFPCEHGGSCTKISNSTFTCSCTAGYDPATHCSTEINECNSNPCQNGAQCVDHLNRYSCVCQPGYMGTNCETDINECQSNPCQNGGSCNDLVNKFECSCTERYNGTICEKDCRPGPADILFVMDSSESTNFNQSKDYVINVIQQLPIGQNDFQVALVTFSWNATLQFSFDQNRNNVTLADAVNDVMWDGGPTFMTQALELAEQVASGTAYGRRPSVPCYVIILSDGLATDLNQFLIQAQSMHVQGIRMMGVGIGKSVSHMNLIAMSTKLQDMFLPANDDLLNTILRETSHPDCIDCTIHTDSDILFLVDNTQIGQTLAAVSHTMREISTYLYLGLDHARVGLMTYAADVTNRFSLKTYTDHKGLFPAFSRFPEIEENANITRALRHARDFGFTSTNGGRSDARKILVIYSGGKWSDTASLQAELKNLLSEGYHLFLIVTNFEESYLNEVTKYFLPASGIVNAVSSHVYASLKVVAAEATYEVCDKDVFTKREV